MNKKEKIAFWITLVMGVAVFAMVCVMYAKGEKNFWALSGGSLLSLLLIFYRPSWTKGIKDALLGFFTKGKK